VCIDRPRLFATFDAAVASEYLAASTSGAYASSTLCGANTRRYHALLAVPEPKGHGVFVLLNLLEEVLDISGARVYLSTNEYPGALFPDGYKHLVAFEMDPLPTFTFQVQGVVLKKTIAMAPNEGTVVVAYELETARKDVTLEVRPLCTFRNRHAVTQANSAADLAAPRHGDWVVVHPYKDVPSLRMRAPGDFRAESYWYKHLQYRRDRERGYSGQEDLLSPGAFKISLAPNEPAYFTATVERETGTGEAIVAAAEATALEWAKPARAFAGIAADLAAGMRDFVVQRGSSVSILRGMPWHTEWARHALLALPGLLALGRFAEAQGVLATWARRGASGLLPRFIDDGGRPGEPNVEATLWFVEAVEQFVAYTKNYDWVKAHVLPFMKESIDAILAGKNPAVKIAPDGLAYTAGSGRTLAPKDETAAFVEVQALLFNALKAMEGIAAHFRDEEGARRYQLAAKALHRAYNKLMWDAYNHVPLDTYSERGVDRTPRPMCLFAVSLSHPILIRRRWEILIDQVESALLTPLGLLAVPPDYSGTRKFFPGDSYDYARRTGGIWPEFLGAFLVAHTKAFGKSTFHDQKFADYLAPLAAEIPHGMLEHLPEFFDSGRPPTPRGAPADAASAGQLIYALTAKVEPRHYGGEDA